MRLENSAYSNQQFLYTTTILNLFVHILFLFLFKVPGATQLTWGSVQLQCSWYTRPVEHKTHFKLVLLLKSCYCYAICHVLTACWHGDLSVLPTYAISLSRSTQLNLVHSLTDFTLPYSLIIELTKQNFTLRSASMLPSLFCSSLASCSLKTDTFVPVS